jgi:hypothetical protein
MNSLVIYTKSPNIVRTTKTRELLGEGQIMHTEFWGEPLGDHSLGRLRRDWGIISI